MEPFALSVLLALAIVILLRRPGVFAPALAFEPTRRNPGIPGDDEDQLPETDRAPRAWLPWAVGGVALVRLACLAVLHA